nr:olfactory receptor 52N4-like [Pelodiscus sinensis]|eukprot:XP_025036017.1 olfactory receptor 52N4-like [Pelodiscus sinensis]
MATSNWTTPHSTTFILLGIPGLEEAHVWISIPFCSVYILSVMGNCLLLAVIKSEPSLHEPMYLFLAMLAFADLVICTTTVPQTLCIFWFGDQDIHIDGCLAQIFLIHAVSSMESGFMLAMAFDRYVAICNPLRHSAVLTHQAIAKIGLVLIVLSYILILRAVFSLPSKEARRKSLSTCSSHICIMLVFYTPATFSFLSHRFGHVEPHVHILIANIYLLFPPMMNPIIYGVRTPGIRQRLLYILGLKPA